MTRIRLFPKKPLLLLLLGLFPLTNTQATTLLPEQTCSVTDVQLSAAKLANWNDWASFAPENASACEGLLGGNDKPYPDINAGYDEDGLLNGEAQTGGKTDPRLYPTNELFDPGAFITSDDLQDIDQDGEVDDPGWIYLGKDEGDGFDYATAFDDPGRYPASLDVGDVVTVSFNCYANSIGDDCVAGTWSVELAEDIVETLRPYIEEGIFDHLAIAFKTGNVDRNYSGPQWAIYDFDIFELASRPTIIGSGLVFPNPYSLAGTFDLSSAFYGSGISHVSVWARDPASTEVPTPPSLALLVLGLLVTASVRPRRCCRSGMRQPWFHPRVGGRPNPLVRYP